MGKTIEEMKSSTSSEPLELLKKAIVEFDSKQAENMVKQAIEMKMGTIQIMDAMTEAIQVIGEAFGEGEVFLPELIGAADIFSAVLPILEEEILKTGEKRNTYGTVVFGTVYGDFHTIGKTMVITLLRARGFDVHDLGVDIKAEIFIEAIEKYDADILGMSALMSTTMTEQEKVIDLLKQKGIRDKIKVMVGGGSVTQEFAERIGADGYGSNAFKAVEIARHFVGR